MISCILSRLQFVEYVALVGSLLNGDSIAPFSGRHLVQCMLLFLVVVFSYYELMCPAFVDQLLSTSRLDIRYSYVLVSILLQTNGLYGWMHSDGMRLILRHIEAWGGRLVRLSSLPSLLETGP